MSTKTKTFSEAIKGMSTSENIKQDVVAEILCETLNTLIQQKYNTTENFKVNLNAQTGDLQILRYKTIVEDHSPHAQDFDKISLSEARKISPDFEIGEEVPEEVSLESFGRRAVSQARHLFMQKKDALERAQLQKRYTQLLGTLISAEVHHATPYYVTLLDGNHNELKLPKAEQIPGDFFKKGEYVKAIVHKVEEKYNKVNITLSRTSPLFLKEVLSYEIPEIADDIVSIKGISRLPGIRSKVAVASKDPYIDPVGTCIGGRGTRIQAISKNDLAGEQIEILPYTDNRALYIQRLLHEAQITSLQETDERIILTLPADQIGLAMGRSKQNLHLASQMLGKPIEIYRSAQDEDIYLEEFADEVDPKIISTLQSIGLNTAKKVLKTDKDDLAKRTNLSKKTIDTLHHILAKEFDPHAPSSPHAS